MRAPALLALLMLLTASLAAAPVASAHHPGSVTGLEGLRVALGVARPEQLVHNVRTVDMAFAEWEAQWPGLVDRLVVGRTSSGQPLLGIRVTDESVAYEAAPLSTGHKLRVYLDGGHHGNEYLGVELVMYYLEDLLGKAAAGDAEVARFLRETEVYAVPIINVDGNTLDTRKNSRQVDPNRNYEFQWGGEGAGSSPTDLNYRGPAPFSEAEVRANAEFAKGLSPDLWITMHTGIAEFYWPWGWTMEKAPDDEFFRSLEKPFEEATNGRVDAMQSAELYVAAGATDDYGYAVVGTPTFTYEVHEDQFIPVYGEGVPQVIADQLAGLDFMVKNVRHMGAWIELRQDDKGWVAVNEGWGVARNATLAVGGQTLRLPDIPPGASVRVELQGAGPAQVSYPVLLIETSRVRTHEVAPVEPAATDVLAPVPGPGLALLALGLVVVARLRRRG